MTRILWIAAASIAVGSVVLGLKALAWWLTGSVALLSDALESTVNVVTAIATLVAVRVAQRPADAGHPYGHHKAEFLSAVLEGVMIIVAALLILEQAWVGIREPRPLDAPLAGLAINGAAGAVNGVWCVVLLREGRRLRSPALSADGHHLLADVATSVGVLAGLLLALATGYPILDPILAALVAVNILWSGWNVMASSLGGLMDKAVPDAVLQDIRDIIAGHAGGAIEAHDLRTRSAGSITFVDFHLVVDGATPVAEAHAICDRIEAALHRRLENALITIHVEPEHKAKHAGVPVV